MEGQGTARGVDVCGKAREMKEPSEVQQLTEPGGAEEHGAKPELKGRKAEIESRAWRTDEETQDRHPRTERETGRYKAQLPCTVKWRTLRKS